MLGFMRYPESQKHIELPTRGMLGMLSAEMGQVVSKDRDLAETRITFDELCVAVSLVNLDHFLTP